MFYQRDLFKKFFLWLAPIQYRYTLLIHEIHLNEGHSAVITHLKCHIINFKIVKSFP